MTWTHNLQVIGDMCLSSEQLKILNLHDWVTQTGEQTATLQEKHLSKKQIVKFWQNRL